VAEDSEVVGESPGNLVTSTGPATGPLPPWVRPPGIPALAAWNGDDGEWQQSQIDDAGFRHGPFRSWRPDGSLRTIAVHDHGKRVGTVWTFHPDGSLFSLERFVDGNPRGVHRRYANANPQSERLQSCCVPPGAWQLRQRYAQTGSIDRGWFNRDGARLLETGELCPERPATVPPQAWFNEGSRAWDMGGVFEESGLTGTRKRWSEDGVLRMVEDLKGGKRNGFVQSFDETGALSWQAHYTDGRLSGPFAAFDLPAGHFADPSVRRHEGSFANDEALGLWRYRDATGTARGERDLGLVVDEQTLMRSPVLANERRSAAAWLNLAEALLAKKHLGEALLAVARATAEASSPAAFVKALDAWTMPLAGDAGLSLARDILKRPDFEPAPEQLAPLVDGIKRGADAAHLLWSIAKVLPDCELAAIDFVTAALLLAPTRTDPLATRALLYGARGDITAARADAARLAADSPAQGTFLDLTLRAYFPRFDFWPAREVVDIRPNEVPLRPERTLPEIQDVIQRYATRLSHLREALRGQAAGQLESLIPDPSMLLPDGPLQLRQWTFNMSPREYAGDEREIEEADETGADVQHGSDPIEIAVDETRGLAPDAAKVLGLLRRARADWSGLVWLCWAVGLDAPGLPEAISPPPAFAACAVMTMERAWRCGDKIRTSGMMALTKGIPGFDWEGTPIDLVPVALADVALDEYVEARAVFSWLCDPVNRSPWQEDLRDGD
jgi:antitoxin component YwqK of YwqJK toxin-antitoxin module